MTDVATCRALKQISLNNAILTGVLIQTPLILGGCFVHTYFCIVKEERPNFILSTGLACVVVGLAANVVYFANN